MKNDTQLFDAGGGTGPQDGRDGDAGPSTIARARGARAAAIVAVAVLVAGLSGCSDFRRAIGSEKSAPDEFEVVVRPPLSLPPGFQESAENLTRSARAARQGPSQTASDALASDPISVTEQNFGTGVGDVGTGYDGLFNFADVPQNIREIVDEETYGIRFERRLAVNVIFGGLPDVGPVLDKINEYDRLRQNALEDRLPNEGGTPALDLDSGESLVIGQ